MIAYKRNHKDKALIVLVNLQNRKAALEPELCRKVLGMLSKETFAGELQRGGDRRRKGDIAAVSGISDCCRDVRHLSDMWF